MVGGIQRISASAFAAASVLFMLSIALLPAQAQTVTNNVDASEVKAKVIKVKSAGGLIRHASKNGTLVFSSKTKFRQKTTALKPIDLRKKLFNKKGAVLVGDDLSVTGMINGVDIEALQNTVEELQGDVADLQASNGGTTYTAGVGLLLSGTEFSSTLGVAIDSSEITDDSIMNADISSSAGIALSKLATVTAGQVLIGNASGVVTGVALSGDGTVDSDGVFALGGNVVGAAELSSSAIQAGDIEVGDLPSLSSDNLTDVTSIGMLDEAETIAGNWVNTSNPWADNEVADALTVSGGTINNSSIGATTASTGNFTTFQINAEARRVEALTQIPNANTVTDTGITADYTSITINTDGLPIIAYYDSTADDLKVLKCGNPSCSSGNTDTTIDSAGNVGLAPSIAIGADGLPIISYQASSGTLGLRVVHCGDSSCSSGNTVTAIDLAIVPNYTAIAIGTDGFPIIAYNDPVNDDLYVAHCANTACTSLSTTKQKIDSTNAVGKYLSIAIVPSDGFPIISYYDETNSDLKIVKCGDLECLVGNVTITTSDDDSASAVGNYSSITIGNDGLPIISYYDTTNGNLKTHWCALVTCANDAGDVTTAVDSANSVGTDTAITIGTDGFPVITFADNTNTSVRIVKCGTINCSTNNYAKKIDDELGVGSSVTIGPDGLPAATYIVSSQLVVYHAANIFNLDYWNRR